MAELELIYVQLDEAFGYAKRRANVKDGGQDMWLSVATDLKTKLIPVLQVGGRGQVMAYRVVHELKGRLVADCIPVFSTDGLRSYFYALTAHYGKWEAADGKTQVWVLLSEFVYGQVIYWASSLTRGLSFCRALGSGETEKRPSEGVPQLYTINKGGTRRANKCKRSGILP
jgi:hypothetical protein